MSDASKQQDWTKPAAMAIPKGGFAEDKVEQGRYGPIFPKSPACYGFSILAKIIPGREEVFYDYAKNIEKTVAAQPDCLAVLKLHYLRWVLFPINGETYWEFILGYPDENGPPVDLPQPEILSRNGSYMAYRRLQEHVGRFRDFLRQHGETPEEQELVAAKLMGRWRSGAPLVLAPNKEDPALGADKQRNNNFSYKEMDPHGYAVPLGSHMRRMNPRDTAANINRRRMIRRGATYGLPLPEDAPDDGTDRGIAAFLICASLIRQFEFAQNVWANDRNFHELGNERDPIIGTQDGTLEYKIPKRPIRKKITELPDFAIVRGGAYFFLPGLKALRYLANLNDGR
jgi:deferrochelatase/peroxidase EfeB